MVSSVTSRNVLMLASTLVTGGAENVFKALALGLPRHGFTTRVACLYGPGEVGDEIAGGGVELRCGFSRGRFDVSPFFGLVRKMRKDRVDVFLALDHHDAVFWGALAAAAAGVRNRILAVHSTGLWAKGGTFSLSDRTVLSRYSRIVALAEAHARYLESVERIDRERIAVINNGIDIERFRAAASRRDAGRMRDELGLPPESFVATIVAALRPEKNHEMLLRSAAEISAKGKNAAFLIVGEGKEAGKLQTLARELSLEDKVTFTGRRNDIPEILSISDVCVLCSHPVVETFPLSLLEAMACGVPVVATAVGSIPEIIEDRRDGLLVEPGNVGALAEAILTLIDDPGMRERMGGAAAAKASERFSEERMVADYAALLTDLIAGEKEGSGDVSSR
jgi:glycosyltransferase involved in cell wall biosynthesis